MRKLIIGILLVLLSQASLAQSDWTDVKVKQTNLVNRFITGEGKIIYRATNNPALQRATYYEYYSNTMFATTDYVLTENGRNIFITFRLDTRTNEVTQIVETQSNPSPSIAFLTIAVNEKKNLTNNGVVSTIYRQANFIDLLYLKTVRGKLLMKN
jgi:hypothetical protein